MGVFSLLALFAYLAIANSAYISASDPALRWGGRYQLNADGSVTFDWESTSVSFSVNGAGATVTMLANITLDPQNSGKVTVFINGFDAQNMLLNSNSTSYLVASSLHPTNNITIHYGMEPGNSGAQSGSGKAITIVGFVVANGGTFVNPGFILTRRIDIIGDSITAGSGYDRLNSVNGPMSYPNSQSCNPWYPTYSYSQAYNWETYLCRYFLANCTTTAWSGGVLINPKGSNCATRAYMPKLYKQALATDDAVMWDFSRSQAPDLAIIYLGTNDYGCNMTTDALFTQESVALIQNITTYYKNSVPPASGKPTQFLLAIGPMSPTKPLNAILDAISQATSQGYAVGLLNMTTGTLDGCGNHPGPFGHWEMALQAKDQIQSVMGW
jgi:lysophospholipase L1-like esterase